MLPPPYKWLETPRAWCLWCPPGGTPVHIRKSDAAVLIRWNGFTHKAKGGSVAQAKRHVERWVAAQTTKPWGRGRHRERLPDRIRDLWLWMHEADQELTEVRTSGPQVPLSASGHLRPHPTDPSGLQRP